MSRDCCVALPRDAMVCLQFVSVVLSNHTHLLFCLHPKNLIEFSLHMTKPLLIILTGGQIPFLFHLENYPVYEKGYKAGHCQHLCLLLVYFFVVVSTLKQALKEEPSISQFFAGISSAVAFKKGKLDYL